MAVLPGQDLPADLVSVTGQSDERWVRSHDPPEARCGYALAADKVHDVAQLSCRHGLAAPSQRPGAALGDGLGSPGRVAHRHKIATQFGILSHVVKDAAHMWAQLP
jgi:hypothetical protein